MSDAIKYIPARRSGLDPTADLAEALASKLVGQPRAIDAVVPYVRMHQANLAPTGRPVGVFLLLGPTGTGKTKTVEALAEVLHGSERNLLRIDCGEFQMEHEVARLIGAPPGYLGHRETQPMITQQKLNSTTSDRCGLSLVLFDEVEKAAPSLGRLLLGVLDKGVLHLGDNTVVNFENSIIFLTSNLGAKEMFREIRPGIGFRAAMGTPADGLGRRLEKIGLSAVRKRFSPEFVNRIDAVVTYEPLAAESLSSILDQQIEDFQTQVCNRLGAAAFAIDVPERARQQLLGEGTSPEYGARELKRTLHRRLIQPMAALVAADKIRPGATVRLEYVEAARRWEVVAAIESDDEPEEDALVTIGVRRRTRRIPERRVPRDTLRLTA
ncbi:MAG: ATP-dependent Clp protease ATP-binding subunit [Bryobacteraceae bacterium]|nr:ATP-dependent Clp protease ATP-binding subunit [Bryobacteraceae bacterium]